MIADAFKAFAAATVLLLAAYGGWRLIEDLACSEAEVHSAFASPETDPAVYVEPQPSEDEEILQRVWLKVNAGEIPPPVEIDG